ncbi:hypothetical protein DYBT9275_05036 [Dyadobacter sp. CECT 9275]|uniref:Glycosyltransferase n=1 Tax=Dyadobacter helix TaxID=2822344 RepID=A0A916JJQ1_9BACT|nr:glycosyltransferase family protein [Dyadobacter sp. CECT 9275]CAG5011838.1 hypothetical protein DYBT9275_05036 [Dyadobacter sp. CECT 9275]
MMRIVFLVQGEGRGHLTQAIALGQMLRSAGHVVAGVMVGKSPGRVIPSFFYDQILAPVYDFDAPNIIYNANGNGINLKKTVLTHLGYLPKYLRSLRCIHRKVKDLQPDLIISFYEIYSGLYNLVYGTRVPMVCIAHQYLLLHPAFTFPVDSRFDKNVINFNSKATSWLAAKRLALSFRPLPSREDLKITVVPPLLRKEIQYLQPVEGDFFLVYMTHHSLSNQIISWHKAHPKVQLQCFWDNADEPEELRLDDTLIFHQINSEKYLNLLTTCKALVTTAGFESVCEAMYLGKPVMMVPVPHHFEQQCNAIDGVISGAGVSSQTFDLSVIMEYLPRHTDQSARFRSWYHQGEAMFISEIEACRNDLHAPQKSSSETLLAQEF